ncbi:FAD-dependent oxidoreductase [Oceanobacillus profundus]|uniref:FAD-dependent oxidoreductase n=1 Tax=Oceanobacillus profundus TaxID=372463 RepID=A0A417YAZ5_9BACI|nr:FAD-dependent oxidoreductase [Oceanobacillus profundus]MCM3399987.1 FAD-dependent oxidoreductase [Oceanobacillus profundus]PAE27366.1 FAD-dependent oxidoreductase [Paenibacillus sp. 7884-2]RHW29849.1 FAD-dependent oxidoreductase [Oceanobacillus profundus]
MRKEAADVIVVGGSLGGCIAALSVAKMGLSVMLTEETDWIGGQLTSQAVPPDEHPWIEEFGCTTTYRHFRNRVRDYYKQNYALTEKAMKEERLNPGNAWVSRLSHEPKVALQVLEDMLAPYVNSGKLRILLNHKPIDVQTSSEVIESVVIRDNVKGELAELTGNYFLDATECGDVLPLAGVEYVIGAESQKETGEPHAPLQADSKDVQAVTHVLAVDYLKERNSIIEKPDQYDFWKRYIPSYSKWPLLSWYAVNSLDTSTMKKFTLFPNEQDIPALFTYRRVLDVTHLIDSIYYGDVSLINWPQNDYFLGSIIDVTEEEREKHLKGAKQLSLSLLYWLQTEAPRLDGGKGYPGLRLRMDVLGTDDGLAKYPYIRESRRIKAQYTITENDVSKDLRESIRTYPDSVGVGSYHLDLHHTTVSNRTFYIPSHPYEIPLGALIPLRVTNLLPACKNIGTTQITNGCYRLHPTEWNIGEAVGYLAAYAIANEVEPKEVRQNSKHLQAYQQLLIEKGIELHWPDEMEF